MAVAVAVAGVIFVGQGQGQGQDHDHVCDFDHPSWLQLGRAFPMERGLFLPPSATSLLVAGLGADGQWGRSRYASEVGAAAGDHVGVTGNDFARKGHTLFSETARKKLLKINLGGGSDRGPKINLKINLDGGPVKERSTLVGPGTAVQGNGLTGPRRHGADKLARQAA